MKNQRYIAFVVIFGGIVYPNSADACIQCVSDIMWWIFPYYTTWIKILGVWAIIFLLLSIENRTTAITVMKNAMLFGFGIILSIGFSGLFPFAILTLFILWMRQYYRLCRHKERTRRENSVLYLNHCTLICLVMTAIVMQIRFFTADFSYHLSHVSAFSGMGRSLRYRILKSDELSDEQLRQMLHDRNPSTRDHAVLLLAKKQAPHAIEWLMNEMRRFPSEAELPTSYTSALAELTGEYFRTPQEGLTWWQNNQQTIQEKASQAISSQHIQEQPEQEEK